MKGGSIQWNSNKHTTSLQALWRYSMAVKDYNELPILGNEFFNEKYHNLSSFNMVLWSYSDEVNYLTDDLLQELKDTKLIRYSTQVLQYHNTLKAILCNAIQSELGSRQYIAVSLNNNTFNNIPERYNPVGITSRVFRNIIEWLAQSDYIDLYKALRGSHVDVQSVFRVTNKLRDLINGYEIGYSDLAIHRGSEPIQLKRAKKLADYEDNQSIHADRLLLKQYEELLNSAKTHITIEGKRIRSRTKVKRNFIEDFKKHGRIYSGEWQNCKSELRQSITLNGKDTVEIDIVNCSLRMALQLSKIQIHHSDLYTIKDHPRDVVKQAINIMFNTGNVRSPLQGIDRASKALAEQLKTYERSYLKEVVQDCYEHYSMIADEWFFQSRGLDLQFLDSRVCIKVIEEFTRIDKIVLTVHDSFIVCKDDEALLRDSIIKNYHFIIEDLPVLR